ncbi:MAG: S-layer homology domain-containing protein [Oscillospiraceae bacterium]|jgi:hypothetical protein|nr:S-layer homology domain-containing protein [Oscillospiraceae bacterium]
MRKISCLLAAFLLICLAPFVQTQSLAVEAAPWDGSVDVSWYDPAEEEFFISTPAELAGLAALVNGVLDPNHGAVTGNAALITATPYSDVQLVGAAGGDVHDTVYASSFDFAYKTVHLTENLDMGGVYSGGAWSGPNWTPIGGKYSMKVTETSGDSLVIDSRFNGVFDGGGHTITNIYCNRFAEKGFPYSQAVGLFGYLGGESDLNPAVVGTFTGGWQPTVRNIIVGAGYVYGRRMVGGVVGRVGETNNGVIIENCANHADIHNTDSKGIGGIVGAGWGAGVIRNCYNTGSVTTTYACPAGGICASNSGMNIYNCYNVGTIDSNGAVRGRGIGGHDTGVYTVENCYYLEGCDDDPASNGWYKGSSTKITINIASRTAVEMKAAPFLSQINASGAAFVADSGGINNGYPVLFFEAPGFDAEQEFDVSVVQPSIGGTIAANKTGAVKSGQSVTLSFTATAGYVLDYYTVNGAPLASNFFLVSENSVVSAVFSELIEVGIALPSPTDAYYLVVSRTGFKLEGAELVYVTDEPVYTGDTILQNNTLKISTLGWDNVTPSDVNLEYASTYALSASNTDMNANGTYRVLGSDDVTVSVTRNTQPKSWLTTADTSWYTGRRLEYTIKTAEELAGLAVLVNREKVTFSGVTIKLANDISLKNTDGTVGTRIWKAIGTSGTSAFSGTFDGQGHKIKDMTAANDGSYAGLFGYCDGAVIRNLAVEGTVSGTASSAYAAGIASYAVRTRIENCINRASVTAAGTFCGGIAAYIGEGSTVSGCANRGAVSGTTGVGGIVGIAYTGSDIITSCVNYGKVTSAGNGTNGTGGIVGKLAGTVSGCANYGDIVSLDRYTGGIAGYTMTKNQSAVKDSLNAAAVSSGSTTSLAALGGIVGYAQYLTLTNSKNTGAVTKAAGFTSSYYGNIIGQTGTVTQTPVTDESVYPKKIADSGASSSATPAGPFKAVFRADGNTVTTLTYAKGQGSLPTPLPSIPAKAGYSTAWEPYALGTQDIAIDAVYMQNTVRGGDVITASGTYFLGYLASGNITIAPGITVTLDGSNSECANLAVTVGAGTKLTLRDVRISSETTSLTLSGGELVLEGKNSLITTSDTDDQVDPAILITANTTVSGTGSLYTASGLNNCCIKVVGATTLTINGGDITAVKTDLFGGAGGAIYVPDGTLSITGGRLTGHTNSDTVAAIYAKNVNISGGELRLLGERSQFIIQAESLKFTAGTIYAIGHSENTVAENARRYYYGAEAVKTVTQSGGKFTATLPFTDVAVTDSAFDGVLYAYQNGLVTGTSATAFSPNSDATRAQLAAILYKLSGSPAVTGPMPFYDVPSGSADYNAILWAYQTGIMAGVSSKFSPNAGVTAEDAALIFARYEKLRGVNIKTDGKPVRGVAANGQNAAKWAQANGILPENTDYAAMLSRSMLADALLALSKVASGGISYKPMVFTDVEQSAWYYNNVVFAVQNKLYAGTSPTTFAPGTAMTRAMLVTVIHRLEGLPAPKGANPFSDVSNDANNWYRNAVVWAAENGIVSGVGGGEFAPEANITREQFVVIIYRYAKSYLDIADTGKLPPQLTFADNADIADWAVEAVRWCYANGMISGKPDNLFDPQGKATRAEVAAIMHKFVFFAV